MTFRFLIGTRASVLSRKLSVFKAQHWKYHRSRVLLQPDGRLISEAEYCTIMRSSTRRWVAATPHWYRGAAALTFEGDDIMIFRKLITRMDIFNSRKMIGLASAIYFWLGYKRWRMDLQFALNSIYCFIGDDYINISNRDFFISYCGGLHFPGRSLVARAMGSTADHFLKMMKRAAETIYIHLRNGWGMIILSFFERCGQRWS